MKLILPFLSLTLLLPACSQSAPPAGTDTATPAPAVTASAKGTVEAVDLAGRTVTIAHGAVEALHWPPMTMTFHAGNVDLTTVRKGDHLAFRFTSTGMNGTLVSISETPDINPENGKGP